MKKKKKKVIIVVRFFDQYIIFEIYMIFMVQINLENNKIFINDFKTYLN